MSNVDTYLIVCAAKCWTYNKQYQKIIKFNLNILKVFFLKFLYFFGNQDKTGGPVTYFKLVLA